MNNTEIHPEVKKVITRIAGSADVEDLLHRTKDRFGDVLFKNPTMDVLQKVEEYALSQTFPRLREGYQPNAGERRNRSAHARTSGYRRSKHDHSTST